MYRPERGEATFLNETGTREDASRKADLWVVTRMVYIILTDLFALLVLATAQEYSPNTAEAVTDRQSLEAFLQKSADELARKYFECPPYPLFAIRRLIELGDPVVIPVLHRAFAEETGVTTRQFIGAALVSLGDPDPQYFEYVAQAAREAIGSDLPFPALLNGNSGSRSRPIYRPEFVLSAQEHGLELAVALRKAALELPAAVEALGEAADPRSLSILVHGLDSPNVVIVRAAAFGLARLHDNSGIQPIIAACSRLAPEERRIIAKALLYFDSPPAQRAAETIIADRQRLERWQAEVNRRGWKEAMRDNGH